MIEQTRGNYPHLDFEVADGKTQNNLMQSSRMLYSIGLKNLKSCGWRLMAIAKTRGVFVAEFGGETLKQLSQLSIMPCKLLVILPMRSIPGTQ